MMRRALFVSNGHGEEAIAARIAAELPRETIETDHLALVGEFGHPSVMRDVGPRRAMPSGGLVAMGNVRNWMRDLRGGLLGLTLAQIRFLREARTTYDVVVAVGDSFALGMAMLVGRPAVFVGTAKSAHLAPYGAGESQLLRRAAAVFVRDEQTAQRLRERGVGAEAPGNVIVDLHAPQGDVALLPSSRLRLGLFPGSRTSAYEDAVFLCALALRLSVLVPSLTAVLSIAPGLEAHRFAQAFVDAGMRVVGRNDAQMPFTLRCDDTDVVYAYRGPIGDAIAGAALVLGQAGTANEAAASAGVPVVAFELGEKKHAWYRMRQAALLGDALVVLPGDLGIAEREVRSLLGDEARMERMREAGRQRMGAPGGAAAIAQRIVQIACRN